MTFTQSPEVEPEQGGDVAVEPIKGVTQYERHEIPIKNLLAKAILNTHPEAGYKRNAVRQIQILENVPDEVAQIIYGDIMKKDEDSRLYHKRAGTISRYTPIPPEQIRGNIQGKLFEILVGHDPDLTKIANLGSAILVNGDTENLYNAHSEVGENILNAGNEILAAIDNPQRFEFSNEVFKKLAQDGYSKIPDDAFIFIDEESRKIIVKGIGEVKSGLLSHNAHEQLSGKSIKSTRAVVNQLKEMSPEELNEAGMVKLARKVSEGYSIDISDTPKQLLILPANVAHNTPEDIHRLAKEAQDQAPLAKLLLESGNVTVINGAFSKSEIDSMADVINERILYWMEDAKKYQENSISTLRNPVNTHNEQKNQEKGESGTSILQFFDIKPETIDQIRTELRLQIENMIPSGKRTDRTKGRPSEEELEQEARLSLLNEMSPDDIFTSWFLDLEPSKISRNKMREQENKHGGEKAFLELLNEAAQYYQMFDTGTNIATQEVIDPIIKASIEREGDKPKGVYDQLVYIDMAKDYFKQQSV